MSNQKTVLVLCTGNSCRSQMGGSILNHDLAGLVRGISAGTKPQPKVADDAIEARNQHVILASSAIGRKRRWYASDGT